MTSSPDTPQTSVGSSNAKSRSTEAGPRIVTDSNGLLRLRERSSVTRDPIEIVNLRRADVGIIRSRDKNALLVCRGRWSIPPEQARGVP